MHDTAMLYPTHRRDGVTVERVIAIQYAPSGPGDALLPFQVFTDSNAADTSVSDYDFDWCRRDEMMYYHLSGCGHRVFVSPLARQRTPPRAAFWYDRTACAPTNAGNCSGRRIGDNTLRRWGYDVLDVPVMLFGLACNPFRLDIVSMDDVEYCSTCTDYLPTGSLCQHIWWCEECEEYSTPDRRCEHRNPGEE